MSLHPPSCNSLCTHHSLLHLSLYPGIPCHYNGQYLTAPTPHVCCMHRTLILWHAFPLPTASPPTMHPSHSSIPHCLHTPRSNKTQQPFQHTFNRPYKWLTANGLLVPTTLPTLLAPSCCSPNPSAAATLFTLGLLLTPSLQCYHQLCCCYLHSSHTSTCNLPQIVQALITGRTIPELHSTPDYPTLMYRDREPVFAGTQKLLLLGDFAHLLHETSTQIHTHQKPNNSLSFVSQLGQMYPTSTAQTAPAAMNGSICPCQEGPLEQAHCSLEGTGYTT